MPTQDTTISKICSKCEMSFPRTNEYWYAHRGRSDGLSSQCKSCQKAMSKMYREEHPEKANARARAWQQANVDKHKAYHKEYSKINAEKARARAKAWEKANPEKVRVRAKAYRQANADKIKEYAKAWRQEHAGKSRAYSKAYYQANAERFSAMGKKRYQEKTEQIKAATKAWQKANPAATLASRNRRRARKAGVLSTLTAKEWSAIKQHYGYRCVYCDKKLPSKKLTMDHIVPLSKNGTHTLDHVVPACRSCNSKKHAGPVLKPVQPLLLVAP